MSSGNLYFSSHFLHDKYIFICSYYFVWFLVCLCRRTWYLIQHQHQRSAVRFFPNKCSLVLVADFWSFILSCILTPFVLEFLCITFTHDVCKSSLWAVLVPIITNRLFYVIHIAFASLWNRSTISLVRGWQAVVRTWVVTVTRTSSLNSGTQMSPSPFHPQWKLLQ